MKSYDQIGGWLAVFRIFSWMLVVASAGAEVSNAFLLLLQKDDYLTLENVIFLFVNFVIFVIYLKIALFIQKQESDTPTRIANLLIATAVLGIFIYFYSSNISKDAIPPVGLVWVVIWVLYFKRSIRVKTFYGNNAFHVADVNNAQQNL